MLPSQSAAPQVLLSCPLGISSNTSTYADIPSKNVQQGSRVWPDEAQQYSRFELTAVSYRPLAQVSPAKAFAQRHTKGLWNRRVAQDRVGRAGAAGRPT